MQKKIIILLVAGIILLGFVSQAFSMGDRTRMKKKSPVSKTSVIAQAVGDVAATDIAKSTITISMKEGRPLTFAIGRKTMLSKGGKNIKLLDVRKGDSAKVAYETIKNKNIAKSINFETTTVIPNTTQGKKRY